MTYGGLQKELAPSWEYRTVAAGLACDGVIPEAIFVSVDWLQGVQQTAETSRHRVHASRPRSRE